MTTTTLITGQITLPANAEHFTDATIYLNLEGNTALGMPPEIAAQTVMRDVSYNGNPIPFTVTGNDVGQGGRYNLRVHISMDGNDEFNKGDYITKRTHTVLKNGAPDTVAIAVEAV
jgi:hypothetical protein